MAALRLRRGRDAAFLCGDGLQVPAARGQPVPRRARRGARGVWVGRGRRGGAEGGGAGLTRA